MAVSGFRSIGDCGLIDGKDRLLPSKLNPVKRKKKDTTIKKQISEKITRITAGSIMHMQFL